jgi:hypothetical protein
MMNAMDKFGQFLISNLRDKTLRQHEMLLKGELRGKAVQALQTRVSLLSAGDKAVLQEIARDLVDTAMHDLLFAIQDSHDRALGVEVIVDGENVAELSGMLQGEPLGPGGWIRRFSKYPPSQSD